jgi:hypothetical protein
MTHWEKNFYTTANTDLLSYNFEEKPLDKPGLSVCLCVKKSKVYNLKLRVELYL